MTDESSETKTELPAPYDWTLDIIVDAVAGGDLRGTSQIGVSLVVQGTVIDGIMISPHAWLEVMAGTMPGETGVSFQRVFGKIMDANIRPEEPDLDAPRYEFLHLKDATVFSGSDRVAAPTLRLRTSEISAWTFGTHNG